MNEDYDEALAQAWYERKSAMMVEMLGPEHDMVMHAIVPYAMGGGLDLYYFPQGVPGTAIATKELTELPGVGSANEIFDTYELVMFTRHALSLDDADDETTPFGRAHHADQCDLELHRALQRTGDTEPERNLRVPSRHGNGWRPMLDLRCVRT